MFYERTPLLNFSETEERANFYEEPLNLKKEKRPYRKSTKSKKFKKKIKKIMSVKRKNNGEKVGKYDQIDPRFDFESREIDWNSNISKQLLKYTRVQVLDPT